MKSVERAYLAGILDGEGCISLTRVPQTGERSGTRGGRNTYYGLTVSVEMTCLQVPTWLIDNFGGSFGERSGRGNRKTRYCWSVHGKNALPVLNAALPFLKTKRDVALLAIDYISTIGNCGRITDEWIHEERDEIFERMAELNKRGIS